MHPNHEQFAKVINLDDYRKDSMTAPGPNHPASKALKSKKQVDYEKKNPESKDMQAHYQDVEDLFKD